MTHPFSTKEKVNAFLCILLFLPFFVTAQSEADQITGYFLNIDPFSKTVSQVEIYKAADGTYEGKVIWTQDEDRKNYEGLVFLTVLTYDKEEKEWVDGRCKYPGKMGSYSMTVSIEKPTQLNVRGFVGLSLLGKTVYWDREAKKRE